MNRRNFLYGSGVALSLPWLETYASKKNASSTTPKRFFAAHHPDGVGTPLRNDPAWKDWNWFPEAGKTERDFRLTKVLDVLEPLRNDICIYSGLSNPAVRNVHGHSNADQFLTGANTGAHGSYKNSISVDQMIADTSGFLTRHSSLVMCTNGGSGPPRGTYTISFNSAGRPVPGLNKPKQIFDMLFKTSSKDAALKLQTSKSALDLLIANVKSLNNKLSKHDKDTLQQYLDAVRDTEVKLAKAQKWLNTPLPSVDASYLKLDADPTKGPRDYIQTIYGLTYLAFLSDSTRIATFNHGRENGGINDLLARVVGFKSAHALTHEVKKPDGWKNLGIYNRFKAEEFGRFIQKLKDTPEPSGQGNMLDNTFAFYGSASSRNHTSRNYPLISAGGKNLGFNNGRYLKYGKGNNSHQSGSGIEPDGNFRSKSTYMDEPVQHLYVSILQKFGVETNKFAGYEGGLKRV